MPVHKYSSSYAGDDYIDIELFSSQNFFSYSITSPSPPRDFEFQICPFPINYNKNPNISPADELFYNGKILPLNLPPRLKMLQDPSPKPFDTSCLLNYSPTKFSRFPTEISVRNPSVKPNDYFVQLSAELHSIINHHPIKKSNWTDKLAQKIKASTSYLKSLFSKSGDEFSCTKAEVRPTGQPKQAVSCSTVTDDYFDNLRYMKVSNRSPFSYNSTSSAPSSSSSNDLKRSIRRSTISNGEIENSVEGAIAYCKKSYQQLLCSID